jgi:hypothetical protein
MQPIIRVSVFCLTLSFIATAALPSFARDFSVSGRRGTTAGTRTFTRNPTGGFQRTGQWSGIGNRGGSNTLNSTLNADGTGAYQRDTTRMATGADGKTLNTTTHNTGTYTADSGVSHSGTRTISGPNDGTINSESTLTTDGQGNYQHSASGTGTGSNGQVVNVSGSNSGTYTRGEGVSSSGTHTINGTTVNTTFDDGILTITAPTGGSPQ